ncbi:hypothetical protein I3760_07G215500 [Carya illinoinensis]|nr:hypothetical protein I3760_07G215500 [Carya illinoinensis]
MRRFRPAAANDISSTTMSSRPTSRGGRWRGFSDRSHTGGRGQGDHFVTGDSHFRSVRDANLGFRRGDLASFADQTGFRPPPLNPRPHPYTQNAQFRQPPPPPYNNQNQRYRQPPPYNNQSQQFRQHLRFDPNQAFRPPQQFRPKPLDYRNWEYATQAPSPNCERFVVLSYNILADYLAINHRSKLYFHIPRHMLDWEWRKKNILFELGLWSADVMCFQEVDRFQELEEELKLRGYSGIWKMRTGTPVDGCAIFWRMSRFKLLHEECIEFNKLGLRDNVAQICVLELVNKNSSEETLALPISSKGSSKVVVCNIHVLYNPKRGEIKLGQVRALLNRAHSVSKLWDDAPVVICGDFNCTPKSPLYNFISGRKLDLSGVGRDKVSGQATAEISAQRSYNSNYGTRSANNSSNDPSLTDRTEIDNKVSVSVSDKKLDDLDCTEDSVPGMSNSQLERVNTVLDPSDESCSDMQSRSEKDGGALQNEARKETQQSAVDGFKELYESSSRDAVDGSRGDSSASHSEGGFSDKYTHPVASDHEEVYSNVIHSGYSEEVNDPPHSHDGSLSEYAESNDNVENVVEVFPPGNPSSHPVGNDDYASSLSQYQASISCPSTSIDFIADEKLENLSQNGPDKAVAEGGDVGEDESTFLSSLHDTEDVFRSDFDQLRSNLAVSDQSKELESFPHNSPSNSLSNEIENDLSPSLDYVPVAMENTAYDPSSWTPMEIEMATGNADCTLLDHPLMLSSTYTEVKDCSGTRDSNGEPLVTSYNRCFLGTVDYIWRSEGLQTVRALAPIPNHAMQWTPGFPTKKWGSDHIALAAELVLVKDGE